MSRGGALGAAVALIFTMCGCCSRVLVARRPERPASNDSAISSAGEAPERGRLGVKGLYPYYHTSEELRSEIQRLAAGCGGAMSVQTVRDANDGKPEVAIDAVHVKVPGTSPKNRVFLVFGEHSGELIGPESGLYFLKSLCGEKSLSSSGNVDDLLRDSEFKIVISANPLSRLKVEGGDYCLRANPDGVDLNRNWDDHFSAVAVDGNFGGTQPFSVPETRIVKRLATDYQPTTFISVHSGTRGMYMPYAYDQAHSAARNGPAMLQILQKLDEKYCNCPYGAAGEENRHDVPGASIDWAYDKLNTKFAFVLEIFTSHDKDADLRRRWHEKLHSGGSALLEHGGHLAHEHFADLFQNHSSDFVQQTVGVDGEGTDEALRTPESCFLQYNPKTKEDYDTTVTNWAAAYLEMSRMVAKEL